MPLVVSGSAFDLEVLDERDGFLSLEIEGKDVSQFFNEAGGHRFQRIPVTETKGRVHTSTVTVAVISPREDYLQILSLSDVEISTTKGSGPGGQHRNKVESAVIALYKPTGERVRVETSRSQYKNKETALALLAARVTEKRANSNNTSLNDNRKSQIGSGMRGDKVYTYRVKDNTIVDHRTGKTTNYTKWTKGFSH